MKRFLYNILAFVLLLPFYALILIKRVHGTLILAIYSIIRMDVAPYNWFDKLDTFMNKLDKNYDNA